MNYILSSFVVEATRVYLEHVNNNKKQEVIVKYVTVNIYLLLISFVRKSTETKKITDS